MRGNGHERAARPFKRWRLTGCVLIGLTVGCSGRRVTELLPSPPLPSLRPSTVWTEPFQVLDPARWREVVLRGHTQYQVVQVDGRTCLRAQSDGTASLLVSVVRFDPDDSPWLSWEWRVDRLVEREALDRKEGADAAARIYVYFETSGLPWQKRSLDYVWSAALPPGTHLSSPFSPAAKLIVVESGAAALGQWRRVERHLGEDYRRCFGAAPPDVVAIGVMSDSDNTGSRTLAHVDELRVGRRPLGRGSKGRSSPPRQ